MREPSMKNSLILVTTLLLLIFPLSAKNPWGLFEKPANITNNNVTININQQQSTETHTNLCAEQTTTEEEPSQKKTSSHTTSRIAATVILSGGVLTICARELTYLIAGILLEPALRNLFA
jgi:hypothetical protein